jgi:hypothetical protein
VLCLFELHVLIFCDKNDMLEHPIENITVTNQLESFGLLAVIKQQPILQNTVKLRAFLWSKTDPEGKLDRT